ncbi:MAG: glycoside hydrolase family 3 N-terminal domain-containing protein, partial [Bacteroidota bacterium]
MSRRLCTFMGLFCFLASYTLVGQTSQRTATNAAYDFPFQDPTLSTAQRVDDLVGRLTLEEKVYQLFNEAPSIERLGIPQYNWWNECLHGVARAGHATVFPQAIGLAASFDEELMLAIGTATSDEARAKHRNFARSGVRSIYTGLTFWSPNINIFRDPRWGRGQETYGEDPYLTSRMAVNFINGLQGDDPKYLKTIATAKHYAVHSGPEETRHVDNIFINDRDLHETYLPGFKAAVEEANVQSIMCAYNRLRDQPCCGSDMLLQRILREDFGFNGYVVTDCGAIRDFYKDEPIYHNIVDRPSQAWGWAIAAGTDLNCEESKAFIDDNYEQAVEMGMLNEADLNRALKRLFTARMQLGMFDPETHPYTQIPMSVVGNEAHQQLALRAAEQSLVLLKNEEVLPLRGRPTIALLGPNAHNEDVLVGNYNGVPMNPSTPLTALRERLGAKRVLYAPASPLVANVYAHYTPVPAEVLFHRKDGKLMPGLQAAYYKDTSLESPPDLERVDAQVDFIWAKTPISGLLEESTAVRWEGVLRPNRTSNYQFGGTVTVKIDGRELAEREIVALQADQTYALEVNYVKEKFWWGNTVTPQAHFTWVDAAKDYQAEALAAAQAADVIIFCGLTLSFSQAG